jgi:hypothetical protein
MGYRLWIEELTPAMGYPPSTINLANNTNRLVFAANNSRPTFTPGLLNNTKAGKAG